MNPTLDLVVALLATATGMAIGWKAGRVWWLVYALSLGVILMFGLVTRWPQTSEWGWLAWTGDPHWRGWLAAMVVPAILMAPTSRLARLPRLRLLASSCLLSLATGVWPLASAARVSARLLAMPTRFGPDRVCRQQTDYTCGPAAAVTGLRRLGLMADEGQLAIAAGTTPYTGTTPEALARVLRTRFADQGLVARVERHAGAADLGGAGVALVVVKYGFMVDHWICVFGVTANGVEVGDPGAGREVWSRAAFDEKTRGVAVVLTRAGVNVEGNRRPEIPNLGVAKRASRGDAADANHLILP
jgi:predicted double-glycine peptidase